MKAFILSILPVLAIASPIAAPEPQTDAAPFLRSPIIKIIRNDLEFGDNSACPKVIFIMARASTEPGNMGVTTGPIVADRLEAKYGDSQVWVQGVGGPYTARLSDSLSPENTTPAAINEAQRLFNLAHQKCPGSDIVAGGYSQGSAVMSYAISALSNEVKNQLKGVVLFGYIKNAQNNGQVPGYPSDNLRVFCNPGDLLCDGTLIITPTHLLYLEQAYRDASNFLISKINA